MPVVETVGLTKRYGEVLANPCVGGRMEEPSHAREDAASATSSHRAVLGGPRDGLDTVWTL